MSADSCVIVGGGQAGGRAAEALRKYGFKGRVALVSEEPHLPYERPPLSKQVLAGTAEPAKCFFLDEGFYRTHDIELRLGRRVEAIERTARRLRLADGTSLAYDRLLLATGARPRRLPLPGSEATPLHYLRTIEDSLALRAKLVAGAHLAVVGGGFIGLEAAAAARARGCRVTVIEAQPSLLARVLAPEVAAAMAALHRRHGVEIRTGAAIEGFAPPGRVLLKGGETVAADAILVGIGIVPNVELAAAAGLAVDNGIVVDEFGRSSDPAIGAAGDVANLPNAILGRRIRLESWQNAQNGAIAAARAIAGDPAPYDEVPWFWSDQYDFNLQMVGLPARWDRVVLRGDPAAARFTAFYLEGARLVAANAVNNARDIAPSRQLIRRGATVDAAALADPAIGLRELVRAAR